MEIIRLIPLVGFLLFCLQIGIRAFVLQRKGIRLSARKKHSSKGISTVLLIAFFLVFLNELVYKAGLIRFSILPEVLRPLLTGKIILVITGIALILLSNLLMLFSLRTLKQSLRFGLNKSNLGKLVTSGIYAWSRNPFFLAINCLFVGISLVFPTPFFITISLLTLVSIHLFILKEERFMHKNYGEEYKNYAKTVRRYF
ncbi:isoprenylcysteine carboxylmethyltransferase family protein [Draconibacterium orientale]|jgi:protein-S-isoprenylcysteine O-methyltransferase Ste14|uniref:methyltransferase family protein n=1 Tax=Draconibacterium orientale TaxID=1168034 RepID=UPI0029C0D546|nr:isoprenylcysteine carboxylmethyltransferase family protein [Draconibacterium orientale]